MANEAADVISPGEPERVVEEVERDERHEPHQGDEAEPDIKSKVPAA
jgi:hypothetical protein